MKKLITPALILMTLWLTACGGSNTDSNKKIANNLYKEEIHTAFNRHYDYYVNQMHQRLKKDVDGCGNDYSFADETGCGDTYVLYDVQTYMQNAIIYADEQGDKEIIEKLLTLILIPFEEQYMTNGRWLNNKDEVPEPWYHKLWGVEVELPLTQYFSLLTRVLSAAERNGISTNLTQREINIIINHIDAWLNSDMNRAVGKPITTITDRHLFKVQSALQFSEYASRTGITIEHLAKWKKIVQNYMKYTVEPLWESVDCKDGNGKVVTNCLALDRTVSTKSDSYTHSGYGSEITKTKSDTDPNAMFGSDGWAKQPEKRLAKAATDLSHARRFNWFFETVKRYGKPFGISIPKATLQGWANNLAYRVSRGTVSNPQFTIFSDGSDGWYRVNYNKRLGFGYTTGDMDIYFVASSYGILGSYNPKIRTWMKTWADKHPSKMSGYEGAYRLAYYTSMVINMRKKLW